MLKSQKIPNIDFAALQTLKVVRELGSISMAARRLDVDQSAVSHTLNRLRRLFDDRLFVRGNRGITATERCSEIVKGIGILLERYERLTRPGVFDPLTAEFELVVALSHAGQAILMAPILRRLRVEAPGVSVRFIQSRDSALQALEAGSCDILIRPLPHEPLAFHRCHLLRDRCVCLVDRESPYADRGITLEEYAAANHILVSFEGLYQPPWLSRMEALGLPYRVALDLASTSEVDQFVAGTDLVATVSEQLAHLYSDEVAVIEAPIDSFQDIYMLWSNKTHDLANMRWIRELITETAKDFRKPHAAAFDAPLGLNG